MMSHKGEEAVTIADWQKEVESKLKDAQTGNSSSKDVYESIDIIKRAALHPSKFLDQHLNLLIEFFQVFSAKNTGTIDMGMLAHVVTLSNRIDTRVKPQLHVQFLKFLGSSEKYDLWLWNYFQSKFEVFRNNVDWISEAYKCLDTFNRVRQIQNNDDEFSQLNLHLMIALALAKADFILPRGRDPTFEYLELSKFDDVLEDFNVSLDSKTETYDSVAERKEYAAHLQLLLAIKAIQKRCRNGLAKAYHGDGRLSKEDHFQIDDAIECLRASLSFRQSTPKGLNDLTYLQSLSIDRVSRSAGLLQSIWGSFEISWLKQQSHSGKDLNAFNSRNGLAADDILAFSKFKLDDELKKLVPVEWVGLYEELGSGNMMEVHLAALERDPWDLKRMIEFTPRLFYAGKLRGLLENLFESLLERPAQYNSRIPVHISGLTISDLETFLLMLSCYVRLGLLKKKHILNECMVNLFIEANVQPLPDAAFSFWSTALCLFGNSLATPRYELEDVNDFESHMSEIRLVNSNGFEESYESLNRLLHACVAKAYNCAFELGYNYRKEALYYSRLGAFGAGALDGGIGAGAGSMRIESGGVTSTAKTGKLFPSYVLDRAFEHSVSKLYACCKDINDKLRRIQESPVGQPKKVLFYNPIRISGQTPPVSRFNIGDFPGSGGRGIGVGTPKPLTFEDSPFYRSGKKGVVQVTSSSVTAGSSKEEESLDDAPPVVLLEQVKFGDDSFGYEYGGVREIVASKPDEGENIAYDERVGEKGEEEENLDMMIAKLKMRNLPEYGLESPSSHLMMETSSRTNNPGGGGSGGSSSLVPILPIPILNHETDRDRDYKLPTAGDRSSITSVPLPAATSSNVNVTILPSNVIAAGTTSQFQTGGVAIGASSTYHNSNHNNHKPLRTLDPSCLPILHQRLREYKRSLKDEDHLYNNDGGLGGSGGNDAGIHNGNNVAATGATGTTHNNNVVTFPNLSPPASSCSGFGGGGGGNGGNGQRVGSGSARNSAVTTARFRGTLVQIAKPASAGNDQENFVAMRLERNAWTNPLLDLKVYEQTNEAVQWTIPPKDRYSFKELLFMQRMSQLPVAQVAWKVTDHEIKMRRYVEVYRRHALHHPESQPSSAPSSRPQTQEALKKRDAAKNKGSKYIKTAPPTRVKTATKVEIPPLKMSYLTSFS
ncbi:hypothetical protein HDU76_007056 [Blyttiomyces sp. JEL0837]|nr:hypothetical protein HDU76_007056 [Blyttiomyces sp. JEL0837]